MFFSFDIEEILVSWWMLNGLSWSTKANNAVKHKTKCTHFKLKKHTSVNATIIFQTQKATTEIHN